MGKMGLLLSAAFLMGISPTAMGSTWYVDGSVSETGDGTSWETAFQTIQEGIDAASDADAVIVAEGIYWENIHFGGKNIILTSTDPVAATVVKKTTIDGGGKEFVVAFSGTETEECVLSGFTIRNAQGYSGKGISGSGTAATIENNVVSGNSYAGILGCQGIIRRNVIRDNRGGAHDKGGISDCHGLIENNLISGNLPAGLSSCNGTMRNNIVCANEGYGFYECDGWIENNTIAGNLATDRGGGLRGCDAVILNCIVWGNGGGHQLWECSPPIYSCIEKWNGGGEGNINFNPHFLDMANGDFHLQSWSPCIDAGDPTSDFSREPEPNGGRVNMGAYGNTLEAASASPDTDADGLPDHWELHWFANLAEDRDTDPDRDGIPNGHDYRYAWNPSEFAMRFVTNLSQGTGYESIQAALLECSEGDEIVVYPDVYIENVVFLGPNVVLRSIDPSDARIVASTIIDGNGAGSAITFAGTEDESCILSGFTIRNGKADSGGGICGRPQGNSTHVTIVNNVIAGNTAITGGGVASCDGVIRGNSVTGNLATALAGGGLFACDGIIEENVISRNVVSDEGAGYFGSRGGGLAFCSGTIRRNLISENSAGYGGGLGFCHGVIESNVITNNSAEWGGGLHECGGEIRNNTIHGNWAEMDGGIGYCFDCVEHYHGTVENCIIWGNFSSGGVQLSEQTEVRYSCIENWAFGGEGNISVNPHIVDAENGDYHLRSWSPCVDAGDPASDFSKEPEPNGGRVNMGAYGNTSEAACKSPDTDGDGLPDDWETYWFGSLGLIALADPDGDHIVNGREFTHAWDPTAAAETVVQNLTGNQYYQTIQTALMDCNEGDEIVVYPGVYRENIGFRGKNIILRSVDPRNEAIVRQTVIDGGEKAPVVSFSGTEDESCVLSGLSITNGKGGIVGALVDPFGGPYPVTRATIENNRITGNAGSGLRYSNGIIRNNIITGNSTRYGGGLYACTGTIVNNVISNNAAEGVGGGLCSCGGEIINNTIVENSAGDRGGGLAHCGGAIVNSIIWGNSAQNNAQTVESSEPTYSCIQDWAEGGQGNIAEDPRFVDAENGVFRLLPGSPCIDAGFNDAGVPETDLAGTRRIIFGDKSLTVDMGAYEYYVNRVEFDLTGQTATLTWSSLPLTSCSVFYSDDLLTWHLAEDNAPSSMSPTSSWMDDGSMTGSPPSLVPRRFYRILEKP